MTINYKTSLADCRAAYRMFQRKNIFLKYDQIFWPSFTVLCICVAIAAGPHSVVLHVIGAVIIYPIALSIGLPVLRSFFGYRMYRAGKNAGHTFTTEITADRIIDRTSGVCELIYEWKGVTGIGQNKKITVICTKGTHFLFFPTSSLTAEQLAEFNQIASGHGIRRWS
jgi:hypothetical protein